MFKRITLAAALLTSSWFANATLIQSITGADMADMIVTVTFGNGGTEAGLWGALGSGSGGVSGTGWSLTQSGDTIGEYNNMTIFGAWTLESSTSDIASLTIDALAGGIVFDTQFGDPFLNGSGAGREFVSDVTTLTVNAAFSDNYIDELFGTMTVTGQNGTNSDLLLASGGSLRFLIDTDLLQVPEPGTLFLFMSGLLTLVVSRRKLAGK